MPGGQPEHLIDRQESASTRLIPNEGRGCIGPFDKSCPGPVAGIGINLAEPKKKHRKYAAETRGDIADPPNTDGRNRPPMSEL
jgi:hypothetical protein